jgi:SAM-dependent methyltransferase
MGRLAALVRTAVPAALLVGVIGHALSQDSKYDTFIPYVPTPDHIVERMLELAQIGPDDYLFDLGSGDGRIVIAAAKKYGARALGIEIDPKLVEEAHRKAADAGVADRTAFLVQDLFVAPLRDATVITLYVLLPTNLELRPRLLEELRPGSRIVSHAFSMGGWLADRHENFRGVDLYLWVVPAHVAGTWEITEGARRFTVSLEQRFQEITGEALIAGRKIALRDAKLRGDRFEFSVEHPEGGTAAYRGKIAGERMTPLAEAGEMSARWSARRTAAAPRFSERP